MSKELYPNDIFFRRDSSGTDYFIEEHDIRYSNTEEGKYLRLTGKSLSVNKITGSDSDAYLTADLIVESPSQVHQKDSLSFFGTDRKHSEFGLLIRATAAEEKSFCGLMAIKATESYQDFEKFGFEIALKNADFQTLLKDIQNSRQPSLTLDLRLTKKIPIYRTWVPDYSEGQNLKVLNSIEDISNPEELKGSVVDASHHKNKLFEEYNLQFTDKINLTPTTLP